MKRIHKFAILISILVIFVGILKVNIEFNRLNGRAYDKKNYEGIYEGNKDYCNAFGEFLLSRKRNLNLKIYISYSPLDIRFNLGRKILYINETALENIKQEVKSITGSF